MDAVDDDDVDAIKDDIWLWTSEVAFCVLNSLDVELSLVYSEEESIETPLVNELVIELASEPPIVDETVSEDLDTDVTIEA